MARGTRRRHSRAKPLGLIAVVALVAIAALLAVRVLSPPTPQPADRPGEFAYYVLALSWSPTYCAAEGRGRGEPQCAPGSAHDFVLHGLWPSHEQGWPEFCATGDDARVPEDTIAAMRDIMPSRGLVIHQYRKHGTCSGLDPPAYFAAARTVFEAVRVPPRYRALDTVERLAPTEIARDFAAANPHIGAESIAIVCGDEQRLRKVRVCLSRALAPVACGANEDRTRLCAPARVVVPPPTR